MAQRRIKNAPDGVIASGDGMGMLGQIERGRRKAFASAGQPPYPGSTRLNGVHEE